MDKLKHYKRYGWKVNEENLKTLPASAPQAAKDLARWLTLEGRRSSLVEWLGQVKDGRIHGKFWPIGAWTQRMAHSSPNQANIPACWPKGKTPKTAVEEVKAEYDSTMRGHWQATPGSWLVGTDAEGIQLRILCHYMKSEDYRDAIVNGDKAKETDIHSLNRKALGLSWIDRDMAKTYIYAWILGAGLAKIATILECNMGQARTAVDNFLASLPELKKVKNIEVPRDAARGYFIGLDGRKVPCDSEHLMLAGYLQNGEAVIMKHANILWRGRAAREGIWFRQVDFVHDEWQVEVRTYDDAERLAQIQCQAIEDVGTKLGLFCPLKGSSKIGRNWKETH